MFLYLVGTGCLRSVLKDIQNLRFIMKSIDKKIWLILVLLFMISGNAAVAQSIPSDIEAVVAPFDMPKLSRPVIPDRTLSIVKTGARQEVLSTEHIQKAIDRLSQKGGGTVVIPEGKWLTGRIVLRSNICLRLEKGAELHFSGDIKDYLPVVLSRNEGIDVYSLGAMIYAADAENIAITGEGKLVGPDYDCEICQRQEGGISEDVGKTPVEQRIYDGGNGAKVFLPVFFGPMNSRNILVEGVTFEHSIFWNIVPTYCENIIIRGVTVNSFGRGRTDGIDIDSSANALIEYTTLDCGDDCFTLKSGRGIDGVKRARPTENVVIRYCVVRRGVGGVTMGTETAAGIRNVYMHDCVMENPSFPFYVKTRRPRGGGAENVLVERVVVEKSRKTVFKFDMLGSVEWIGELAERFPARTVGVLTPKFGNMTFKDIVIKECPALINAKGLPEQPIEGLVFENIQSPNMQMQLQDVGTLVFK